MFGTGDDFVLHFAAKVDEISAVVGDVHDAVAVTIGIALGGGSKLPNSTWCLGVSSWSGAVPVFEGVSWERSC